MRWKFWKRKQKYKVDFSPEFLQDFNELSDSEKEEVNEAIEKIRKNPYDPK